MMLFHSDPSVNLIASRMAEGALRSTIRKLHQAAITLPAGSRERRRLREAADAIADTIQDWRIERETLCPHTGLEVG